MPTFPPVSEFPRPNISPQLSRTDNCCSRAERCCWTFVTWLPIAIVYGATLWAVYVNVYLIALSFTKGTKGVLLAIVGLALYGLCIWSYSVAVFTDPGSPIEVDNGYSYLPQWQPSNNPSMQANLTVKNDGRARYCQKCDYTKPDRTHHCSVCRRCVLKMDHHCPWLGTCIGFGNYKSFVLFLIYLTLFCFETCIMAAFNLWYWISYVTPNADYLPVQWILVAVIAGVVSLCVGGFTIWHIIHLFRNITTIEALEKTRYIHTFPSNNNNNYNQHRRRRSSNDATNAFDIGKRQNWEQVMGPSLLKWFIPVQNSIGNGLAFPVNEDVRGILRGMRGDLGSMENVGSAVMEEDPDEEDTREYRRDAASGRWMMHD